ncbi:MAG: hypothetical protein ACHQ6U_11690 [Thermodesulfobacteriota bacterium]
MRMVVKNVMAMVVRVVVVVIVLVIPLVNKIPASIVIFNSQSNDKRKLIYLK